MIYSGIAWFCSKIRANSIHRNILGLLLFKKNILFLSLSGAWFLSLLMYVSIVWQYVCIKYTWKLTQLKKLACLTQWVICPIVSLPKRRLWIRSFYPIRRCRLPIGKKQISNIQFQIIHTSVFSPRTESYCSLYILPDTNLKPIF